MLETRLKKLNIQIKGNLENHSFEGGVTNRFLKFEDINGNKYLIRINGKLWPPFTREDEAYNLDRLKKHGIETKMIFNDKKKRYQICNLEDKKNRLSKDNTENHLKRISLGIKKFHQIKDFKGSFQKVLFIHLIDFQKKNKKNWIIIIKL